MAHINPGTDTTINPVVIDSYREKKNQRKCLNCDSCGNAEKTNSESYPFKCLISKPVPMMVHEYCVSWFGYVGCASHTSAPSQQRIDEVIMVLGYAKIAGSFYETDQYIDRAIALLQAGRK